MAKIIALHNNKGGVLKTTLSVNIGGALALSNKKVLIIDLDEQGNTLSSFGRNPNQLKYTIYDIFFGEAKLKDVIVNVNKNLDVLPSNKDMSAFEYLMGRGESNTSLEAILKEASKNYDYILVDTSASLGVATLGALYKAQKIIIPFEADKYGLGGLVILKEEIETRILGKNKELKEVLFVPTKYVSNSNNQNDVLEQLETIFKEDKLFTLSKERIRRSVIFQNSVLEKNNPLVLTKSKGLKALKPIYNLAKRL